MKKGFPLIELIMVIVIIAILSAIAVPKFIDIQENRMPYESKSENYGDVEYFCHEKGVSVNMYEDSRVLQKEFKEWKHDKLNSF